MISARHLCDSNVAEEVTEGLAHRLQVTLDAGAVELLEAATVDHVLSHGRSDTPDMAESDAGEFTSPAEGYGDATDQGEELVAAVLAAVEAGIGDPPNTVY